MRAQGFEIDTFLKSYETIASWIEKHVPAKLNLAATAAAEHFTAILADGAFKRGVLDQLDPRMRKLLAWHAAEEIEHKSVAFDVLREIDPSYALRLAGLAHATTWLCIFWLWATVTLARQEKLSPRQFWRTLRQVRVRDQMLRRVFVAGIRQYIKRDFHPRDTPNENLAAEWFAMHGLEMPDAA
jgi:hypothetical protein